MVQRILEVKDELRRMVVSEGWSKHLDSREANLYRIRAHSVALFVLSVEWWSKITTFLELLEPVYTLLRLMDGKSPCMGKLFHGMNKLTTHVGDFPTGALFSGTKFL